MYEQEALREKLKETIENADGKLLRILHAVSFQYSDDSDLKEEKELHRLVYTSARSRRCSDEDIEKILEASRKNNARLNVTGILIHTRDRFLQVLEGEKDTVMSLYKKIEKDDRHGGSIMRFCEPVTQRYFSDWEMAGKRMDSNEIKFNTSISEQKKKLYQSMMDGDLHSYKDEGMRVLKTFLLVS
ncbi:MAG: BLUF domain-containing protein [Ekhidna sp.]|uniref:BLUF domain-containing protein n=1 Tax=Ekhidna sp. TaxID=2608089 RepID=UPI0032EEF3C1